MLVNQHEFNFFERFVILFFHDYLGKNLHDRQRAIIYFLRVRKKFRLWIVWNRWIWIIPLFVWKKNFLYNSPLFSLWKKLDVCAKHVHRKISIKFFTYFEKKKWNSISFHFWLLFHIIYKYISYKNYNIRWNFIKNIYFLT